MAALIAVAIITALNGLATSLNDNFNDIANAIDNSDMHTEADVIEDYNTWGLPAAQLMRAHVTATWDGPLRRRFWAEASRARTSPRLVGGNGVVGSPSSAQIQMADQGLQTI